MARRKRETDPAAPAAAGQQESLPKVPPLDERQKKLVDHLVEMALRRLLGKVNPATDEKGYRP
jgi:hypothetical protein